MRQFLFFMLFFIGLFWVIDVIAFGGENSAGAWQEVQRLGEKFTGAVNDQIRQVWR
jgi:hypothetical protein